MFVLYHYFNDAFIMVVDINKDVSVTHSKVHTAIGIV